MKDYIKGLATGLALSVALVAVPAAAKGIDVVLNGIRINSDGVNIAQWSENYIADNGKAVPYSIQYEGTIYLPIRIIGELTGKQIYWNGDTRTATIVGNLDYYNENNPRRYYKVLAKKPDLNGNIWTYAAIRDYSGPGYIKITDEARGFCRVYNYTSGQMKRMYDFMQWRETDDVLVMDDGIVFTTSLDKYGYQIRKIYFNSDADTQDGVVLSEGERFFLFDNLMVAYGYEYDGSYDDPNKPINPFAEAINLQTGKRSPIGAGDFEGTVYQAFNGIAAYSIDRVRYEGGYLYFDSYVPYYETVRSDGTSSITISNNIARRYRVKIQFADTPVTGDIEYLGDR